MKIDEQEEESEIGYVKEEWGSKEEVGGVPSSSTLHYYLPFPFSSMKTNRCCSKS